MSAASVLPRYTKALSELCLHGGRVTIHIAIIASLTCGASLPRSSWSSSAAARVHWSNTELAYFVAAAASDFHGTHLPAACRSSTSTRCLGGLVLLTWVLIASMLVIKLSNTPRCSAFQL